jgi:polar amino acid transport system permease protein
MKSAATGVQISAEDGEGRQSLRSAPDAADVAVVRRRKWGSWLCAAVVLWLLALTVRALAIGHNIDYGTVRSYLFDGEMLAGLRSTLLLTVSSMALAMVLGVGLAGMRVSRSPLARTLAFAYIWLFRGVPALVQLIIWFNLSLIFKHVVLGVPGIPELTIASWDTNTVITPFVAALLGLGLAESAYYSEIVRGGLLGVDRGQREAAMASGMTGWQTFRYIVSPQSLRITIPPTGNEVISMLKYSSIASVVGYTELAGSAALIYGENAQVVEILIVISIWYIACTSVLSVVQYWAERHFGRGYAAAPTRRSLREIWRRTLSLRRS